MSNPLVHAFFVGRAIAEVMSEQVERAITTSLSELGKFDAEQRERMRQFTADVLERATLAEEQSMQGRPVTSPSSSSPMDLQAMVDDLRAEIAQLRVELQRYRNRAS